MNLFVSEQAEQDLDDIEVYIERDNPAAAVRLVQRLTQRFEQLTNNPRSGKERTDLAPGLRSMAEGNYIIFYRILDGSTVEIARVLHSKRDLGKILGD